MKFHNRAFPYPILDGSDYSRDDYIDGGYQASFENSAINEQGKVVFTIEHFCTVDELRNVVSDGKAKFGVLVTCSDTSLRKFFTSEYEEQKIEIEAKDLYGRVEIWPQIVAVAQIEGFSSEFLNEEFKDLAFDLEPGDVLATDDSVVRFFEFNRLSFETLISARSSQDLLPFSYSITLQERSIYIDMGVKLYELFMDLRAEPDKRPFLAMSIYKDCFYVALNELATNPEAGEYRWARALEQKLGEKNIRLPEEPSANDLNAIAQQLLEDVGVKRLAATRGAGQ